MTKARTMVTKYEDDLRLFRRSRWYQVGILLLLVAYLLVPTVASEFQIDVLNRVGYFAIGAIGLNLLTGYTGQVSLGHAFFVGVGAYVAAYFGTQHGWPLLAWLPMAALLGGLIGAFIGPFALRLRGQYLAIITLGLLFVGEHVFDNWESVTGGGAGTQVAAPLKIGPLDFGNLKLGSTVYSRNQGLFFLIWAVVAIVLLLARNLVRTRPGRALQAVRDRDLAAEIIGVSQARYKISAFAVSSMLAAMAGGFYAVIQQYVSPTEFGGQVGLFLSIQFIAIIIVGGVGTLFGSVLGAFVVGALPRVIENLSTNVDLPFVSGDKGGDPGFLTVFSLNQMLFGLLIVAFLLFEPRGLAAVWFRIKAYFKSWPFSY
ncbi:MAG: branched-chain amino acid transporter permease [Acidimicrobiales bacterium]|nr:branched-chain amino acid transporter permease [Acidimicrobiales bacterium]